MAISVVKDKKATKKGKAKKTKGKDKGVLAGIVQKLNQLGDAYQVMHPVNETLKELTKGWKPLFSEVQDYVDEDNAPDTEVTLKSDKYAVTFTKHGLMTSVTDSKKAYQLLNKVKPGLGLELMSFPVGELKKYLTPAQVEAVTTGERSKARSVTVIKLDE